MRNHYIYRHIRADKNQVFYIGMGSNNKTQNYGRALSKKRNPYWTKIARITEVEIEIICDGLTFEEAILKEQEFIALYRRVRDGGTLANLTIGGEGAQGNTHSEETKLRMRQKALGRIISPEQREKARINSTGKQYKLGYKHAEEFKQGCRERNLGKVMSEGAKKKIGDFWRGKPRTDEVKEKISKRLKGHVFTDDAKERIRQTILKSQLPIKQFNMDGEVIGMFKTTHEAALVLGRSVKSIRNALRASNQTRTPDKGYHLSRIRE